MALNPCFRGINPTILKRVSSMSFSFTIRTDGGPADFGIKQPAFQPQLHQSPAVRPWASCTTSLNPGVLVCKTGAIIVRTGGDHSQEARSREARRAQKKKKNHVGVWSSAGLKFQLGFRGRESTAFGAGPNCPVHLSRACSGHVGGPRVAVPKTGTVIPGSQSFLGLHHMLLVTLLTGPSRGGGCYLNC